MIAFFVLFFLINTPDVDEASSTEQNPWAKIDQHALNAPRRVERGVDRLADYFSEIVHTDAEKARIIYRWITDRIAYDTNAFFMEDISATSPMEVLRFRKAVCSGYAVLFKSIADALDLESEIITGHSKGYGFDPVKVTTLAENHAWIAVNIDGDWKLIDPTWGAGHIPADSRRFEKNFSEFYFFTNPEKLIYTHYPSDSRWQLLDNVVDEQSYLNKPLITTYFYQSGLQIEEHSSLFINTEGSLNLSIGLPEDVSVTMVLRHKESGHQEPVFMRYRGEIVQMEAKFSQFGEYRLDIFARSSETEQSTYHLALSYIVQNENKIAKSDVPELLAYYSISRSNLRSPVRAQLSDSLSYKFKISIPEATEVFLVDGDDWHTMELRDSYYSVVHQPKHEQLKIIAKINHQQNYGILVTYSVTQTVQDEE